VSIPKKTLILKVIISTFIILSGANLYAQFSGSVILSGFKSTNVDGRDSATPDNIFNPSLDLLYNWDVSTPISLRFEATVTPNLYQNVVARSFVKNYLSATGNIYLSDIRGGTQNLSFNPSPPLPHPIQTTANSLTQTDTTKPDIVIKPIPEDRSHIASTKLAALSELLDSFEIDKKGIKDDSIDVASDLKDSVSESVLVLSEVLRSQVYTESIAEVVTKEILHQKNIFASIPMPNTQKKEVNESFDDICQYLRDRKPQSDILPLPKPDVAIEPATPIEIKSSTDTTKDLLAQALEHLKSESDDIGKLQGENAPTLTLVNSQTELKDFSTSDVLLKEDLIPLTSKTLATLLSIPVSLETQNNKGVYIGYSYREFIFAPRIDLYFGKFYSLGTTYQYTNTIFPNDTTLLNDGKINQLRLDSRIELTPSILLIPQIGIGFKSYGKAIVYSTLSPVKGRPNRPDTITVITPTDYRQVSFGATLVGFPTNDICLGFTEALSRSPNLRPYLFDSLLTQKSRIGGTVTDDEYSYDLTRESIFFLWNIILDLKFAFDLSYENRHYANVEIKRRAARLPTTNIQRDDKGPVIGLNLSKEFLFDSRLISVFSSLTPTINFQYTNFTSTVAQFKYKDMTTTLSFEFDF